MENYFVEEKNVTEYICDSICSARLIGEEVENARFHHNTLYKDAVSICQNGILTLDDLNKKGIKKFSDNFLTRMEDTESHVNGTNCVSLAVVGLTDLYPNEDVYNPYDPSLVDFLVSSDVKASRSSIHYGNEFLSYNSIIKEYLKSIDIRLLKLLSNDKSFICDLSTPTLLQNYNSLREIAIELKKQKLYLPIREMSESNIFELDQEKLVNQPKLLIKK